MPNRTNKAVEPTPSPLRRWISGRPVVAGTLTSAGGAAVMLLPARGMSIVLLPGLAGVSGFVLGALICACGLFLWFSPHLHAPIGVAAVVMSLASFVTTNVGGLVIGLLLGVLGGSLGFAWAPPRAGHWSD